MTYRDAATIQVELAALERHYADCVECLKFFSDPLFGLRAAWQRTVDGYPANKATLLQELHKANGRVTR